MTQHFSLCRSVGSGIPFTLGGGTDAVTVLLQPMRLKDWGVLEQILLRDRKQNIGLDSFDSTTLEALKDVLMADRSIDIQTLFAYATTHVGASWRLWLSLRQQHPYSQCMTWVDTLKAQERLDEYLGSAAQIDGIDTFAGMDWPKPPHMQDLDKLRPKKEKDVLDWKLHIAGAAETYHIDPAQFGELTYYQVMVLLWDRDALQGKTKISPDEFRKLQRLREARKFYEQKMAAQQSASLPLIG